MSMIGSGREGFTHLTPPPAARCDEGENFRAHTIARRRSVCAFVPWCVSRCCSRGHRHRLPIDPSPLATGRHLAAVGAEPQRSLEGLERSRPGWPGRSSRRGSRRVRVTVSLAGRRTRSRTVGCSPASAEATQAGGRDPQRAVLLRIGPPAGRPRERCVLGKGCVGPSGHGGAASATRFPGLKGCTSFRGALLVSRGWRGTHRRGWDGMDGRRGLTGPRPQRPRRVQKDQQAAASNEATSRTHGCPERRQGCATGMTPGALSCRRSAASLSRGDHMCVALTGTAVRGCPQTSRFWGGGSGSDSDSGSDASSSSSDSDSEEELATGPSKYLQASSSDDESDDGRRVVRSAKDKRYLELEETCKDMLNKQKINDW